jgi:hypothetical protein
MQVVRKPGTRALVSDVVRNRQGLAQGQPQGDAIALRR